MSYVDGLSPEEVARLDGRKDRHRLVDEYCTARCLTDPWWFAEHGLGLDMRNYWWPLHGRLARFLSDWTMVRHGVRVPVFTKLVVISREHRKTWWNVIDILWELARDVSSTHMLRSHKDDKVEEIVRMCKQHIQKNERFRKRFPWVRPEMEDGKRFALWKSDRFRLESKIVGQREASVEGYGIKSDATGSHYDFIHYDDITNAQIEESDVERAKMLEKVKHDGSLGKAGTRRIIFGTPYHVRGLFWHFDRGELSDIDYDLFWCPATFRVPGGPWECHEPLLLEDRKTLRLAEGSLPESDDWTKNLQYCQARLTVWSEHAKDVHTEIREVEWNDHQHVRLNRPLPEVFGAPTRVVIQPTKPSAPNTFTLDDQHAPAQEDRLPRASLVLKRRELGSTNYASQWDLNPVDPEKLVLRESDIRWIEEKDLPTEHIVVVRTTDFASRKNTKSSSCFLTGWWHVPPDRDPVLWIRHIKFGNLKATDLLLELFVGVLRVESWGAVLRETTTEEEGRWQTIQDFVRGAQLNPYETFCSMGGEYRAHAERHFADRGAIMLRNKNISRGRQDKKGRIAGQLQPAFHMGMVGCVRGIEHIDDFLDEVNSFTLEDDSSPHLDILDTLADQIQYGPSQRRPRQKDTPTGGLWAETQRRALYRSARQKAAIGWRG